MSTNYTSFLRFGDIANRIKKGGKFSRNSWNGKGQFIYYVPSASYPASGNTLETMKGEYDNDLVPYREYLALKTVDGSVVPWSPSVSDVLTDDWFEVSNFDKKEK